MGNDIYLTTIDEKNSLHIAVLHRNLNLCKTLVTKYNFDMHVPDEDGWNALDYSIKNCSLKLLKLFLQIENRIQLKKIDRNNCLHILALYGHMNLCKVLIYKHNFDVLMAD